MKQELIQIAIGIILLFIIFIFIGIMLNRKRLWIRELDCGHERPTNINFIGGIYEKPKIGDDCHCRECCEEIEIIGVREAIRKDKKELLKLMEVENGKWK